MMRGGPLNPGKGFGPRKAGLRRGALVRNAERTRQARKPLVAKPQPVTPEERRARKALRTRSEGHCEMCGSKPAQEAHHRQARSQGGAWVVENLLHLDSACHHHATVNPALAYERGWSVRSTSDPAEQPVWLAGRGWSYLRADGSIQPAEENAA